MMIQTVRGVMSVPAILPDAGVEVSDVVKVLVDADGAPMAVVGPNGRQLPRTVPVDDPAGTLWLTADGQDVLAGVAYCLVAVEGGRAVGIVTAAALRGLLRREDLPDASDSRALPSDEGAADAPYPSEPSERAGAELWAGDRPLPAEDRPLSPSTPPPQPVPARTRTAYPRLDVDGRRNRAGVVVIDEPFDVTVGLAARRDRAVTGAGPIQLPTGSLMLDVVFVYDPDSLVAHGPTRHQLHVTADAPYPALTVRFTAQYGDDLGQERRIGVHYLLGDQVIGFAWKTIIAVDTAADVPRAPGPQTGESSLLDLTPLLGQDAPDLILAVFRPDSGTGNRFVWSAYPAASGVWVPDGPRVGKDLGDVAAFATNARRTIQFDRDEFAIFRELRGDALLIGDAIPPTIRHAIRAAATAPGRTSAAAILLLTEEVCVPWELASFRGTPLQTPFGGDSPFLGAHVAIGRWPLTDGEPKPLLRTRVDVDASAVLTADYTGVPGWPKLDSAVSEASALAMSYPPAAQVKPRYDDVIALFDGQPPVDVVHVALHGQFDEQGTSEGLVLVATTPHGMPAPQFLKPIHVEAGELPRRPFVFLNACQVGSDKQVLGDYGGLASTLLRKGACSVVAPLWNIDDSIASTVALGLYADAYGPNPQPVAEYLREVRATYTAQAAQARTPNVKSTLIAYQFFGHPRLLLRRGGGI